MEMQPTQEQVAALRQQHTGRLFWRAHRAFGELAFEKLHERGNVAAEPDPPASLFQVLAAHAAELGVVPQQVRELAPLLHQVAASQSVDLLLESRRADEFAQHEPGVVETQGLIEIRCHEKVFTQPWRGRHGPPVRCKPL